MTTEFRCTFDLLGTIPSASDPAISVKDEFFAFNARHPFNDRARLIDRNGHIVHGPRFGLSMRDGFDLVRLALTPEARLDGRRIEEFFSPKFFSTEFWLIYSTIMGSLPQHSAAELRRYLNRTLHLFPDLSDMAHILRTPFNQYQTFIEPLVAWLRARGVNFLTSAFVRDIGFAPSPGRITVDRLDYERDGAATSVTIEPEDLVLVTFGSQAADLSVGSMTEAPRPRRDGRSWELWKRLAQGRTDFGNPDVFFGAAHVPRLALGDLYGHHDGDGIPRPDVRADGQRDRTRRAREFDRLGLAAVAVDLPPAASHRPAARHVPLVGLRLVSGTQRRFCAETHGCMHRRGDPRGGAAATAVRPAIGRDHGVIDLHPLRHALREQHLDAAQRAPTGPGRFRRGRPISDSSASTWRFRGMWRSPSNTPPARRGKRFTSCSSAARRRRPSIRPSTI